MSGSRRITVFGKAGTIMQGIYVFIFLYLAVSNTSGQSSRSLNQRCRYRGIYYLRGQQLTFKVQNKRFDCTCMEGGRLDCTWVYVTPPEDAKCLDSGTGQRRNVGETWERVRDGRTFDCVCNRGGAGMEVECTDENRCHLNGVSYVRGSSFTARVGDRTMSCTCLAQKEISCRYDETRQVPTPERDAQLIESYVVYGGRVLRPQITTLQACRTGAKVITSGVAWNQTSTNALGMRTLEQCACIDAIVKCKPIRILDQIEPHCISIDGQYRGVRQKWLKVRESPSPSQQYECVCRGHEDISCRRVRRPRCVDDVVGTIRVAGERWIRVHERIPSIRFECTCNTNKQVTCEDIGECDEPSAPVNGALLCAEVGNHGPRQVSYCKPMCLADFEFVNSQRYYRIWEVCGSMNLHRWSGGFLDDPDAIARCRARSRLFRRGHQNLYLPTNNCQDMTEDEIENQKDLFLRQLHYRSLCREKCEITLFKCGRKS